MRYRAWRLPPKTLSLAWARALHRGDIDEAERLVAEAKKSAMKPEGIQTMEQATSAEALMIASKRRSRAVAG